MKQFQSTANIHILVSVSSLKDYERTVAQIKELLEAENAPFVDASDISGLPGTFDDHQHHSSYGAWLIYKKIKSFLNEEHSH